MRSTKSDANFIRWFDQITIDDVAIVGGKTASLGEMYGALSAQGIKVPYGFAVTADAFAKILDQDQVGRRIYDFLRDLDVSDSRALAEAGRKSRALVLKAGLPTEIAREIREAYATLCRKIGNSEISVAVRSSATAEDLPEASFAGQQETFLNVCGDDELLDASLKCFASLFTDRAISYREGHGFDHEKVKLSVCVQQMVRADRGASGVIFTLDTESGSRNVVLVTSAYGLGENVVGGKVDPDEFLVAKGPLQFASSPIVRRKVGAKQYRMVYSTGSGARTKNVEVSQADREALSLSDEEVVRLAKWSMLIENHYSKRSARAAAMDIEWAKDGETNELYILQARPETVHSTATQMKSSQFVLHEHSRVLLRGRAVGSKIGVGRVKIVRHVDELSDFAQGNVLVSDMTEPDWEPVMKKAAAIVTNRGGRTCHAAIVSREHGVPCIVGTGTATKDLSDDDEVTVSCSEGEEGRVYEGALDFKVVETDWQFVGKPLTKIMVNLGNPDLALETALMPVDGVGLARLEFIIGETIKVHPMALVHFDRLAPKDQEKIRGIIGRKKSPPSYFVEKLSEGIGLIAAAFYPRPVIVRFSDFKTNEYSSLIGGKNFEPLEENPMIGFRGASRYYDPKYREGFALECRALRFVREEMGMENVKVMIPFCRTVTEGKRVLEEMARHGLTRGDRGLEVYVMCELPSNVTDALEFGKIFDGFSIGSNDLTQMTLGVDRDSEILSHLFDERDPSVMAMLGAAVDGAKKARRPVGICGQAPSDYPEVTEFLVEKGIDSISVTPDSVLQTFEIVLGVEKKKKNRIKEDASEKVRRPDLQTLN